MKLSHRTLVVLAAALLILPALGLDSAHPAEDKAKDEAAAPWRLASNTRAAMQLQAAADYIQDEDWKSALRLLQHLLDGERGSQSKQPEILVLDINNGRMIAHNKTPARAPGNLVFVGGKLISLSPWEIVAYPSRKGKLKEH